MAITVDSFVGRYEIPQPYDGNNTLQDYIDHYIIIYMNELFGAEMYQDYLNGVGIFDPLYTKLQDPFQEDIKIYDDIDLEYRNKVLISEGIDKMLICLIYAHYKREDLSTPSSMGDIIINPEGGERETDNNTNVFNIYNQGIKTYKSIQLYIVYNNSDYTNFKGEYKGYSWLI